MKFRPSAEIKAQLEAFKEALPKAEPDLGDFAAQLQWESWENHRLQLERELAEAETAEAATIASAPVTV